MINRILSTFGYHRQSNTPTQEQRKAEPAKSLAMQLGYKSNMMHPNGITSKIKEGIKKALSWKIKRMHVYEIKAEMDKFREARAVAENPLMPDRKPLYAIYHNLILDDQITTQYRVATNTIVRAPFQLVNKNGKADKKLAELFRRPWFMQYLRQDVNTEFYGHSVIEFNPEMQNNEFQDLVLIPRDMVRPEFGDIMESQTDTSATINYRNNNEFPFLLELGEPDDLGLLLNCCIPAIRKKYADTDWSIASEKFGMPYIVVNTESRQDSELDRKELMLKNFASNGWSILDDRDKVELIERTGNNNAHIIYLERIKLADQQIGKIINGQNSTSDEKSFTGAAQVHERILNDFTFARMTRIEYNINFVLIPFLVKHGYPLAGYRFQFKELQEKEIEASQTSPNTDNKNGSTQANEKKNLGRGVPLRSPNPIHGEAMYSPHSSQSLYYIYSIENDNCCKFQAEPDKTLALLDFNALFEKVLKQVFNGKLQLGSLSFDLWKQTVDALHAAINEGSPESDTDIPEVANIRYQLKNNAMAFVAFKNHQNMYEVFDLLTDENGNPRNWNDFKTQALKLNKTYNINHLQAEYETAKGAARMASNYHHTIHEFGDDVMLRYETVGDKRVRKSHEKLDGTTKRITDPFWDTFYPPNGVRCRCDVVVADADAPEQEPNGTPDEKEVPDMFRHNPAKTGEIFSKEHPYYTNTTDDQKQNIEKALKQFTKKYNKN